MRTDLQRNLAASRRKYGTGNEPKHKRFIRFLKIQNRINSRENPFQRYNTAGWVLPAVLFYYARISEKEKGISLRVKGQRRLYIKRKVRLRT